MKRLVGERLVLEPVTAANAVTLWRVMQNGHLREFQDVPRFTRQEFERRVAARPAVFDMNATGRFEWIVVRSDDRRAIGWVSLRVGDHARGAAEIGYSILSAHRGLGFATEATALLVEFAFDESDLRRVDACCVPENTASRRLLSRLGFDEIRIQRSGAIVRGRPVDIVLFEMPRDRWASRRAAAQDGSANSIAIPASSKPK